MFHLVSRFFLAILLAAPGAAVAKTVDILVTDDKGRPVAGAVVTFMPAEGAPLPEARAAEIVQKNIQFQPFTTVVPVASTITFRNDDTVLHHVFSFSKAKRFELKLFGRKEPQQVTFDQAGIISVGCNIHDGMISYINVVSTPYAAQTGADGQATLADLPKTDGVMTVWHPLLKSKGNQLQQTVSIREGMTLPSFQGRFRRGANPIADY